MTPTIEEGESLSGAKSFSLTAATATPAQKTARTRTTEVWPVWFRHTLVDALIRLWSSLLQNLHQRHAGGKGKARREAGALPSVLRRGIQQSARDSLSHMTHPCNQREACAYRRPNASSRHVTETAIRSTKTCTYVSLLLRTCLQEI